MSTILDALRRGRAARAPGPNPNAAQTDAVLQTLGYGRFSPTAPLNRLKRAFVFLALAVVLGAALWFAVVWLTRTALSPAPLAAREPAPAMTTSARASQSAPEPAPASPTPSTAAQLPATDAEVEPGIDSQPPRSALPPVVAPDPSNSSSPVTTVQRSPRPRAPVSAPPAPPASPSRSATSPAKGATVTSGEDHFARAMMYQRLGDFENALVSYRQILQRDDLNVEAHNNLGVLYRDKGLYDDAIRHFQRAIAINPSYPRARNNLGVVYLGQRKLDAAATQFHAALAIDPGNVESMVNLSTVEKESGRREQGRIWLARALEADPRNAEAHYNFGLFEDEGGNRAKALTHYRAFLQYGAAAHPGLVGDVRARLQKLDAEGKN